MLIELDFEGWRLLPVLTSRAAQALAHESAACQAVRGSGSFAFRVHSGILGVASSSHPKRVLQQIAQLVLEMQQP